jgi:inosine-uridine nucleoside N-ribohydrolase
MTVVDVRNHPKSSTNAFVVLKADKAWFLEAMSEDFKKLEA